VTATEPVVSDTSHPAEVVDVKPFTQGDVALLHTTGVTAPMLSVAQATPVTGDSVVAAGYPGSVAEVVDASAQPTFVEGTVSGTKTVNGTPFTQISAELSAGMSGGPVLNMAGQVGGTVSWAPSGTTSANFMTDVGSIRSILAANGVNNTLTPADKAVRQGLAYYFASRYHEAVKQFDRTLALQPGQPIAQKYRQMAVARYPQDVNPPSNGQPWWIYVAVGAAVLVLAGAAGLVLMRRRRARPPGAKSAKPVPEPTPPAPTVPVAEPAPAEPTTLTAPVAEPSAPKPTASIPEPALAEPVLQSQPVLEPAGPRGPTEHETPLFCPNCGAKHTEEAHYCERCGQPFARAFPAEHGGDEGVRR
jgi:serine protease Do